MNQSTRSNKRILIICEACTHYSRMYDPNNEKWGMVNCSIEGRDRSSMSFEEFVAPDGCPFKLEHMVLIDAKQRNM